MAIARGAGTEIIRSAHFENDGGTTELDLIFGVQHHIYTVLSIIVCPVSLNATTDTLTFILRGYDAKGGTTAQDIRLFQANPPAGDTYVFNDKFSFNGHEPTDFAGPLNDATKQDAIADQASAVAQKLICSSTHANDTYEIHVTYIDQNNS